MLGSLVTALELGLIYTPMVLGVNFTFRILRFPDLTAEASFVCGAALSAILVANGFDGYIALIFGAIAGGTAGLITGILHSYVGIDKILSGVLTLGLLYSINIHIMNGPNVSLINRESAIAVFQTPINHFLVVGILSFIVFGLIFLNAWFLKTGTGLALRATGDNERTAQSLAINIQKTKIMGIVLGNALVGLSGALLAQYQGFSDISMGSGALILVIAALMLGEIFFKSMNITVVLIGLCVGSIVYQIIVATALQLGMPSVDLKLVTALLVIGIIASSTLRKRTTE